MKKKLPWVLLAVFLLAAVLALLIYRYLSFASLDPTARNAQLREIRQLDAETSLEVLRSSTDLNKNYDNFVDLITRLTAKSAYLSTAQGSKETSDALSSSERVLAQTLVKKVELVETFKSHNAIWRNALRYVNSTINDALHPPAGAPNLAQVPLTSGTATALNEMQKLLLSYVLAGDDGARSALSRQIEWLQNASQRDMSPQGDVVRSLATQALTVIAEKSRIDQITAELNALQIEAKVDAVARASDEQSRQAALQESQWRWALIGYTLMLLVVLLWGARRLSESYRSQALLNEQLQRSNAVLDERVQARTQELSQAMTQLKESQLQMMQSEKMSSLGQMAAGIAHEINTPLAYVRSSLETVASRMEEFSEAITDTDHCLQLLAQPDVEDAVLNTALAKMDKAVSALIKDDALNELKLLTDDGLHGLTHIAEIVVNLKDFSRLDRAAVDRFNINEGIRSTLKIAHHQVKSRDVVLDLQEVQTISCNPSQINQLILNLVNNAVQATSESDGRIVISTRQEPSGISFEVKDNGTGMPEEVRQRIFDPFFTTKRVGEGTGLGLSIVKKIIDSHQGEISVSSVVGKGTCFRVQLPLGTTSPSPST